VTAATFSDHRRTAYVLIDATHKRWILATIAVAAVALTLYLLLARLSGGLTGGTTVGLWYGIIGTGLMIYAGLLAAHRKLPVRPWIGPRKVWLRGHIWLGLLSGVFLLCHSGFRWGGPLEVLLWATVIGVLVTGILGLLLQQVLPRLLTVRVEAEGPFEQIPHLCQVMRRKADDVVDAACGPFDPRQPDVETTRAAMRLAEDGKAQLRAFYEQDVRPFLAEKLPGTSPLATPYQAEARFAKLASLHSMADLKDPIEQLAALCQERRQLADQERIHYWLHTWLLVHVPLSVALLVLGIIHVVFSLRY
jgi:hypothetical protein